MEENHRITCHYLLRVSASSLRRMSIAPGVPLQLVDTSKPDSTSHPAPRVSRPIIQSTSLASDSHDTVLACHIAASPSALSDHLQSTSAVLSDLHPSPALCAPSDLEDLILLDGSLRRRPPVIPAYCPYRVQLEPDCTYRWCACGRSKKQPWCDDSHTKTDPQPVLFRVGVQQKLHYLCGCKYTSKPPFCDGSHIHAVIGAEEWRSQLAETGS